MTTRVVRRTDFERDFRRIELVHEHPLLRAVEFDAPRREPTTAEVWLHPIAALLLVGGLFGFAWACGVWP